MHKVFVYGSLLKGMGNHSILEKSTFLGNAESPKRFIMVDLGYFPGIIEKHEDPNNTIKGEVYEVDDATLNRLDRLEGYNSQNPKGGLYDRIEIDTEFGKTLTYTYNNHYERSTRLVENGDWRTYYNKRFGK